MPESVEGSLVFIRESQARLEDRLEAWHASVVDQLTSLGSSSEVLQASVRTLTDIVTAIPERRNSRLPMSRTSSSMSSAPSLVLSSRRSADGGASANLRDRLSSRHQGGCKSEGRRSAAGGRRSVDSVTIGMVEALQDARATRQSLFESGSAASDSGAQSRSPELARRENEEEKSLAPKKVRKVVPHAESEEFYTGVVSMPPKDPDNSAMLTSAASVNSQQADSPTNSKPSSKSTAVRVNTSVRNSEAGSMLDTNGDVHALWQVARNTTKEMKERKSIVAGVHAAQQQMEDMRKKYKQQTKSFRFSDSSHDGYTSSAKRVAEHHLFSKACTLAIVINSVCIGIATDYEVNHEDETEPTVQVFFHACNLFFLFELLLRWYSEGALAFMFFSEDRLWNRFDALLVLQSIIDTATSAASGFTLGVGVAKTLKVMKMLRVLRLIRMFRFFTELTALAIMIARSVQTLLWAVVLLLIISYCFAIWFTQSAATHKRLHPDIDHSILSRQFGNLGSTCYHLTLSALGGISWIEVSDTMLTLGPFTSLCFFFYIAFTILAVLNIITGVFVDNALETGRKERSWTMQKERETKQRYVEDLKEFFEDMDTDASGSISYEEMFHAMQSFNGKQYFDALGVEQDDMVQLWTILDGDETGDICIDEFLNGCLKLRGEAKSIDIQHLLFICKNVLRRVDSIKDAVLSRKGSNDTHNVQSSNEAGRGKSITLY